MKSMNYEYTYVSMRPCCLTGVCMCGRPAVDFQGEGEHTGGPEESPAHPGTQITQETVAGSNLTSPKP